MKLSLPEPEEVPPYSFPGYQRDPGELINTMSPMTDDVYQNNDESQPLTSESQQDTPTHVSNQMMATRAVSFTIFLRFILIIFVVINS